MKTAEQLEETRRCAPLILNKFCIELPQGVRKYCFYTKI